MARRDPYRNFRFRVEIDGANVAGFSDVEIGASTMDVLEYREGNEPTAARKLPGRHKLGDISLKRGLTPSTDLWSWFKAVVNGDASFRKDVSIIILGEDGSDQLRFIVHNAWPMKFEVGPLRAKGNDVVIETLELANEGIERVT